MPPENWCGLIGQTLMSPWALCGGYKAGTRAPWLGRKLHCSFWIQGSDYRWNSPLQYPGTDFSREVKECETLIVGTHSLVPLLEQRVHQLSLPVNRHWPKLPLNAAKVCQPTQPHNTQRLEVLRVNLIHLFQLRSFQSTSVTSFWVMTESNSSASSSSTEGVPVGLDTVSPLEINSFSLYLSPHLSSLKCQMKMTLPLSWSSGIACPDAMCTNRNPYVRSWLFVMDKLWLPKKSINKTLLGFRLGRLFHPITTHQYSSVFFFIRGFGTA